jgi:signal transduction histidine kinase
MSGRTTIDAEPEGESRFFGTVALRAAWEDLGTLGRFLVIAFGLVIVVIVLLAQTLPSQVERGIIEGHVQGYSDVAERMDWTEIPLGASGDSADLATLDSFVQENLAGHDTVRIKIWSPNGTIAYSNERSLIGTTSPQEPALAEAFTGRAVVQRPASSEQNRSEDAFPPVWKFLVPVPGPNDRPVAVVEIHHLAAAFSETADSVWRFVTVTSVAGVAFLILVVLSIMVSQGRRSLNQQKRAATMFGDLVRARADEREHIVGALHDDIGQRLYRIHYGLQYLLSRTDDGAADRLQAVDQIVLEADSALRAELKSLRHGAPEELRLDTALHELVELTEAESPLAIEVDIDPACKGEGSGRIALFRAVNEAIVNVRKHADATRATIVVRKNPPRVVVTVEDDGIGSSGDEGVGLAVVRERLEVLGGGLKVRAAKDRGTRVTAWLPVEVCEGDE